MSYGPNAVYTVSMASGATLSSAIVFGRSWGNIQIHIPTMASGTDIYIQASPDGSNFRRVYHSPTISSSTPGPIFVNSSITNCAFNLDLRVAPQIKIELSTAMTATPATFKVVGLSE